MAMYSGITIRTDKLTFCFLQSSYTYSFGGLSYHTEKLFVVVHIP